LKQLGFGELRAKIATGNEQADRGQFVAAEQTFAEIRKHSTERSQGMTSGRSFAFSMLRDVQSILELTPDEPWRKQTES
jgi:hypothetical protein